MHFWIPLIQAVDNKHGWALHVKNPLPDDTNSDNPDFRHLCLLTLGFTNCEYDTSFAHEM